MQSGIAIQGNVISGILRKVTGYTGFSGDVAEQNGHYLALKFETEDDSVTTVELVGGSLGHPVTLDSDLNIVIRITNINTQSIRIVTTKGEASVVKTLYLTGLTLAA